MKRLIRTLIIGICCLGMAPAWAAETAKIRNEPSSAADAAAMPSTGAEAVVPAAKPVTAPKHHTSHKSAAPKAPRAPKAHKPAHVNKASATSTTKQ